MDIGAIIIIIAISVLLVVTFYIIGLYNTLIDSKNRVEDKFVQIDMLLKKRVELIPNLVETVKKYTKHESKIIEELENAKSKLEKSSSINSKIKQYSELNKKIGKIYSLRDTYQELNKDKIFNTTMKDINENEDRINYARTFYNDTVLDYNNIREKFPSVIVAKVFKFKEIEYLK